MITTVKKYPWRTIFFTVALAVVFYAGINVGTIYIQTPEDLGDIVYGGSTEAITDLEQFWEVWELLEEKYPFDEPSTEDKVHSAISGLVSAYGDPYTVFLPPSKAQMFEADLAGEFGGLGVEIEKIESYITVISPLKDTPAWHAGIEPNDMLIEIEGVDATDMSINDAVGLIRGKPGTILELTIRRPGKIDSIQMSIERDIIKVPIVETRQEGDVFIIELATFTQNSADLLEEALAEFSSSDATSVILDLRGNPGGLLDQAIIMAGMFLPEGTVVVQEHFGEEGEDIIHRTSGNPIFPSNIPLALLVDQGSASASEILGGALQEHERAALVGTRTFGKGSVQQLIKVGSDDSSLKVTIAKWLTPNGLSISDNGLTPNTDLSEELRTQRDELLALPELPRRDEIEDIVLQNTLEFLAQ
ncbi:MAG: carboxyl-terminal processing protease [Planctomycetota bacterium]|jgi:carboxyl-terminal processing protease